VAGLQSDYPHTIHTLLKSADKLLSELLTNSLCVLCSSSLVQSDVGRLLRMGVGETLCYGCARMLQECDLPRATLMSNLRDIVEDFIIEDRHE